MKLPLLFVFILLLPAVSALEPTVLTGLEWANFIVAAACIFFALRIVKNTGAVLGRAFVFITASLLFFGSVRLFFYLADSTGVFIVSETTAMLGWHFLFYIATALLIAALQSLKSFGSGYTKEKLISPMMVVLFLLLILVGVAIFISAGPLDERIELLYGNSLLHHYGVEHFIAFAMMAYATYLLVSVKHLFGRTSTRTITNAVAPMFVATTSFTLLHLWELLTESWNVLAVPQNLIEPVEGVLFLTAMVGMLLAIWQIKRSL